MIWNTGFGEINITAYKDMFVSAYIYNVHIRTLFTITKSVHSPTNLYEWCSIYVLYICLKPAYELTSSELYTLVQKKSEFFCNVKKWYLNS